MSMLSAVSAVSALPRTPRSRRALASGPGGVQLRAKINLRAAPIPHIPQRGGVLALAARVGEGGRAHGTPGAQDGPRLATPEALGRRAAVSLSLALPALAVVPPRALAGIPSYNVDKRNKEIETVELQMGSIEGGLVFEPSNLTFVQGRVYKLHMTNPSPQTHYFTALEFASKIFTVLAGEPAVEVKGAVQEVALKSGASATWIFVPMKAGVYPLKCSVKGHEKGGMTGTITVTGSEIK